MDTELSLYIVLLSFKLSEVGTLKFSVLCTDDIILVSERLKRLANDTPQVDG
jgi:hypothetical protein